MLGKEIRGERLLRKMFRKLLLTMVSATINSAGSVCRYIEW